WQEGDEYLAGGSGRTRCEQTRPAQPLQLIPDILECAPTTSPRPWWGKTDTREPGVVGQIRDSQRCHVVAPQVSGHRHGAWHTGLGQVPVPLGPRAPRAVGQVERVDHPAVLPAIVARRLRTLRGVDSGRYVTKPRPGDGGRIDIERGHGSG